MRTVNRTVSSNILLNTNYNSPYQQLKNIYTYSIAAIITGTPTGTIALQASNDPETNDTQNNSTNLPPTVAPTNWVTITGSTFTLTAAGETLFNVDAVGYNYVRVTYTDTSGGTSTARLAIIFNGKGV